MLHEWVHAQRTLLTLEREEEKKQLADKLQQLSALECQENGISLLFLELDSINTTLYGKALLVFHRRDKKPLPAHSFKVGDEVIVSTKAGVSPITGIVSKVTNMTISIVSSDDVEELEYPVRLDMSASDATHNKMMRGLTDLSAAYNEGSKSILLELLFGCHPLDSVSLQPVVLYNTHLNCSQVDAISYALASPHVALIHGPPGTGKTTATAEYIVQEVARGSRVLVCAPSNVAVDNMLLRLLQYSDIANSPRLSMLRIGHPARVNPLILPHTLDALVMAHEGTEIVADVRQDMDNIRRQMRRADRNTTRSLRSELGTLRKELRKREDAVQVSILESRNIILSTCVGASARLLKDMQFDVVVIDEAAQALEAACWIPLLHANKCVLAGDHCQLPPTIKSAEAARSGLAVTLFERIITSERLKDCSRMLSVQYRMHADICDWASREMYHSKLQTDESVASHNLRDLHRDTSTDDELDNMVLLLVDTAGCVMEEEECSGSYRNQGEAKIVKMHVDRLMAHGLHPSQIGIITPYNAQLELLREVLLQDYDQDDLPPLDIKTVDGFQGGEKEAIILSLVRSNSSHVVGFLAEERRINVAVTRAKRHVAIVCDSDTCGSNAFLNRLINYASEHGDHRSGLEYVTDEIVTLPTTVFDNILNDKPISENCELAAEEVVPLSAPPKSPKKSSAHAKPKRVQSTLHSSANANLSSTANASSARNDDIASNAITSIAESAVDTTAISLSCLCRIVTLFAEGKVLGGALKSELIEYLQSDPLLSTDDDYRALLDNYRASNAQARKLLRFPPSLTSYMRLKLHDHCENLSNIKHTSAGSGTTRCLEIHRVEEPVVVVPIPNKSHSVAPAKISHKSEANPKSAARPKAIPAEVDEMTLLENARKENEVIFLLSIG